MRVSWGHFQEPGPKLYECIASTITFLSKTKPQYAQQLTRQMENTAHAMFWSRERETETEKQSLFLFLGLYYCLRWTLSLFCSMLKPGFSSSSAAALLLSWAFGRRTQLMSIAASSFSQLQLHLHFTPASICCTSSCSLFPNCFILKWNQKMNIQFTQHSKSLVIQCQPSSIYSHNIVIMTFSKTATAIWSNKKQGLEMMFVNW